jgi:hypothetical protein
MTTSDSCHRSASLKAGKAACGSTFLNRIFRKYLESTFSDNDGWDEDTVEGELDRFATIAKRKFNGD